MRSARLSRRRHAVSKTRPAKVRLLAEPLEDRTLLSNGEWLLRLEGLSGTTIVEQMQQAQALIDAAQIQDVAIAVVDHATIDGNIVIEAPELTPLEVLDQRLHALPGFLDVQPFFGEEEEGPNGLENGGGEFEPSATEGPVGPGANLSVGLVGNEPTLAVNPLNPNNVVVAQFNNGAQTMKISLNGGASFPIQHNAVLPSGQTFFQGDDSLAFDAQGRLFWTYLTGGSPAGPNVVSLQVNPTTGAVIGSPSFVANGPNLDKEWIAADHNPSSPFANNLYVIWHDFNQTNAPVRFARSTNQGVTWTILPGNLNPLTEGFTWPSEVAVAPNGDVWVAWHTNTGATNGEVRMRRSTDGGLTFGPEIIPFPAGTGATTTNSATGLANKISGLHVWLQGSMQPRILIDPARPSNIYVVSVDDPDAFVPTNDPSDIVIARSTDNGATWTRSTISQGIYGDSEIMPAASIDTSGNLAVTWYDNRRHLTVPDSLGGTHYLLDLYATTSFDGGLTFTAPLQINDPANTFDPERGAPDRFGNHTLRIGEYNGLSVVNGTAYATWTGNTVTGQQIMFDKFSLGLTVTSTVPAIGSVVTTQPTTFTVNVSSPVDPASLAAGDFTVNSIAADGVSYTAGTTALTFSFTTSPVTAQGVQTMHVDAGAFSRASDASPVVAFNGTFRYDVLPLQVVSTNPPFPSGVFTLPAPLTYDVTFNEAVDPGSVQTSDLVLSGVAGATVTGVTVLPGTTTARFTIGGVTTEGTLNASIAAGAVTDAFGNPGSAFSASYLVDYGTVLYPTPLTSKAPLGSLIYDPSQSGVINFDGDTDSFTLNIDAGQTITISAIPDSSSTATIEVRDPSGNLLGMATGAAPGKEVLLQTLPATVSGTYTVSITGAFASAVAGPIFSTHSDGTRLGTINRATGAGTDVGPFGTSQTWAGAFGTDGTLYTLINGFSGNAVLARVNQSTGAVTPIGGGVGTNMINLEVAADGTMYGIGYGDQVLYKINTTTGAATPIGNTGINATMDLAFNPAGVLYATVGNNIWTINTTTAASTFVGTFTGILSGSVMGIMFDDLGTLFATAYTTNSPLYKIDLGTLAATVVGNTTFNFPHGGDVFFAAPTSSTYQINVILNAALEEEGHGGSSNNALATAQDLTGSFVTVQTPQAAAQRGAASGGFANDDDFYAFSLVAGQSVTLGLTASSSSGALFGARTDLSGFSSPASVTFGDVNGDAKQDMVVANDVSTGTVSVLLGTGTGGFGAPTTYPLAASNPWTVVLGDVNGDGKRDLVTANINSGSVSVLLGNGAGGFGAAATYAMGTSPYGVAVGDLNGDGIGDVVSANYNTNNLTVRLGQASGVLGAATSYLVSGSFFGPTSVALGDFNSDGKLDVVSSNYNGNNISLLLGNGLGGLGSPATFAMGTNPWNFALGDLNGDGKLDVVTGNYNGGNVSVRLGDGLGGFGAVANYASGGANPIRVAVGDVNADGKADIAVSNTSSNLVGVLLNNGGGTFGTAQALAAGSAPSGIALADLNGDGLLDMSTANFSSNNVSVWLNATVSAQLQLQDGGGAVLATGAAAANLSAAINNFVAPATGTYYARVFGGGSSTYNLVVTRDAAFDTEANDTFATAQTIGTAQGALGAITTAASTSTAVVVPNANANVDGDFNNGFPFHIGNVGIPSMRYQQIYAGSQLGGGGVIDQIRFRKDAGAGANFSATNINVKINLSYAATSPTTPSTVFANNVGSGVVTVFDGLLNLSSSGTGSPMPFDIVIDVANLFNYNPAQGNLLVDIFMRNAPVTTFFDAVGTSQNVTSRIFSNTSVNDTTGSAFISGLVTRFDFTSTVATQEDWYTVNVASTANGLRLETGTPADGPDQFVNTLNPKIELYNPSGALVASGVPLADGRNEFLQYQPLVTGAYRVRVTGETSTVGEYFLTKNFSPVVTTLSVTPSVDENGMVSLSGTLSDPDALDTHTVVITWGPGEGSTTLTLAAGVSTFSASHPYLDDNPTGTASDPYPIGLTVTDNHGASGTAATSVTVNNVAPTVSAGADVTVDEGIAFTSSGSFTDPGTLDTWTATVDYGDGSGTQTLTLNPDKTFNLSHAYADNGTYTVTVEVTDDDTGVGTATFTVTVNNVPPAVTSDRPSQDVQYSDPIAAVTVAARDVTRDEPFVVATAYTLNGGPAQSGLPNGLTLTAGTTTTSGLFDTRTWTLGGKADVAPGTYVVTVSVTDKDGATGGTPVTLNVLPEDARAYYSGALFVSTSTVTSSSATVTLSATIKDITAVTGDPAYDPDAGTILNATVTFINRDTNTVIASNVPLGLVSAGDTKVAAATYNWSVNIGQADSQQYTVGIIVGNYYTRNSSADDVIVTVSKPLDSFVTGGGYVVLSSSAGEKAGDAGSKNNFGFSVKFNQSGSNLQGRVNTTVLRTEADGLVHTYQIKGNVINSLAIQPATTTAPAAATFTGKASIQDITNPLAPVSVEGNATLQMTMTDKSEPGSGGAPPDTIGITVWNKNGGLWFSSNWDSTRTIEQNLAGGNLQVRPANLEVAGGPAAGAGGGATLSPATVQSLFEEALAFWRARGVDAGSLEAVNGTPVQIVDLAGPTLGVATPGTIWLDRDAAGYGWSQVDPLMVVAHEMGHLLGFEHTEDSDLMAPTLSVKVAAGTPLADLPAAGPADPGPAAAAPPPSGIAPAPAAPLGTPADPVAFSVITVGLAPDRGRALSAARPVPLAPAALPESRTAALPAGPAGTAAVGSAPFRGEGSAAASQPLPGVGGLPPGPGALVSPTSPASADPEDRAWTEGGPLGAGPRRRAHDALFAGPAWLEEFTEPCPAPLKGQGEEQSLAPGPAAALAVVLAGLWGTRGDKREPRKRPLLRP